MKAILATAALGVTLALGSAAVHATDMSKTIRVAFQVDVTGFDPQATNDLYSAHVNNALFDNLFEFDYYVRPARLRPALAEGKTAYILVDALRFEMARELLLGLDDEYQSRLMVAVGTVPTITEIGMAALMPGAEGEVRVVPAGEGKVGLQIGNTLLKDRQSRLAWLRKQVTEPLVISYFGWPAMA